MFGSSAQPSVPTRHLIGGRFFHSRLAGCCFRTLKRVPCDSWQFAIVGFTPDKVREAPGSDPGLRHSFFGGGSTSTCQWHKSFCII